MLVNIFLRSLKALFVGWGAIVWLIKCFSGESTVHSKLAYVFSVSRYFSDKYCNLSVNVSLVHCNCFHCADQHPLMYTAHFYVAVTMSVKISQMKLKAPCVMGRCMKMYSLLCYKIAWKGGGGGGGKRKVWLAVRKQLLLGFFVVVFCKRGISSSTVLDFW